MTDTKKKFRAVTADARKMLTGLGLSTLDVDMVAPFVEDLQVQLRLRNRLMGKASETIGRLRAENARLRLERAEWRGTVNGDVLVEVLAASAPEQWTPEDRRRHAEHVIEAMQASGIEVRHAVRSWWPKPGALALIQREGGPEGAGMIVRIDQVTDHGTATWDSVDGEVVGSSVIGVLRPLPESYVDGGR